MPEYSAQFAGPHRAALHSALTARLNDFVGELSASAPDVPLDAFIEFDEFPVKSMRFPCVFVSPTESELSQAPDDSHIAQEHALVIEYAFTCRTSLEAVTMGPLYMTAIDRVVRRMSQDDWGIINDARGPVIVEAVKHVYRFRDNDTTLRGDGQLTVVIQHMER